MDSGIVSSPFEDKSSSHIERASGKLPGGPPMPWAASEGEDWGGARKASTAAGDDREFLRTERR